MSEELVLRKQARAKRLACRANFSFVPTDVNHAETNYMLHLNTGYCGPAVLWLFIVFCI